MQLEDLMSSEIFLKEGSAMNFLSPKEYITPFMDEVSKLTSNFRVEAISPVSLLEHDSEVRYDSYGRFKIEAIMPSSFDVAESESTIGLIVALDTAKPIMKIYHGKNVKACLNMTIFNPDFVYSQEMTGNAKSVYSKAHEYVQGMQASLDEYAKRVTELQQDTYKDNALLQLHGRLVQGALKQPKLGHTVVIQGMKELLNNKSVYYAKGNETSAWNYYNSITEFLGKSDILDRPTKTLLLSDLFLRKN